MKYDKFLFFSVLSREQQQKLEPFIAPDKESSLFKHVPLTRMEEFKTLARTLNPGHRVRVRFRGKRSGAMRDYTKKCDAHSVTIYVD